jgi:hypothetical protein
MNVLETKAAIRARDGNRCTKCGMMNEEHLRRYGKSLEVHRTTPGSPYTHDGCVTLCKPCHGPQPRRKRNTVGLAERTKFYLDPALKQPALDFIASHDRPPALSRVLERALKEFFAKHGYWPPKTNGGKSHRKSGE